MTKLGIAGRSDMKYIGYPKLCELIDVIRELRQLRISEQAIRMTCETALSNVGITLQNEGIFDDIATVYFYLVTQKRYDVITSLLNALVRLF